MTDLHRQRLSVETRHAIAEAQRCCAAYRAAKGRMDEALRSAWERLDQAYRVEQASADLGRVKDGAGFSPAPAPACPPPSTVS